MAAFTQVQSLARSSGDNSFTIVFGSTPTAGNALFLLLSWVANGSNNVDVDITDDTSGALTWHTAVTSANEFGARTKIAYAYDIPALSGPPTVTITRQGAVTTHLQGSGEEWSGFGGNDPKSATISKVNAATTSHNTNTSAATAELDALIFAVIQESTITSALTVEAVTPAWTQVWEATAPNANGRGEADYKIVTAGGTQIARWTSGAATNSSASLAAFCLQATPSIERVNQAVQTLVTQDTTPVLRGNQIAQSLVTQNNAILRCNQVVLTIVEQISGGTASSRSPGTARGIYVPTRGIAGSEGGGAVPFTALNYRRLIVPPQRRGIYVPIDAEGVPARLLPVSADRRRIVYVAPQSRTIDVAEGEGYTHR